MSANTARKEAGLGYFSQVNLDRALAKRNFVRAVALGRELNMDGQRIKELQRAAIRQFVAEYKNFEGAARLIAEYSFTAAEIGALSKEILQSAELYSQETFVLQPGEATYESIARQICRFFDKEIKALKKRERSHIKSECRQMIISEIRSWLDVFLRRVLKVFRSDVRFTDDAYPDSK